MAGRATERSARMLFQVGDSCSRVAVVSLPLRAAVHCVTASLVFQQDRRSKVALHEEGSRQSWTHRHAVSLHTSDFRTAAALHSSDAQTLLCKQVSSWSVSPTPSLFVPPGEIFLNIFCSFRRSKYDILMEKVSKYLQHCPGQLTSFMVLRECLVSISLSLCFSQCVCLSIREDV